MRDQYDDLNRKQLFGLSKIIRLPEFVKTAEVSDAASLAGLGQSSFADPVRRKFPINSRHDAWLSRIYFSKNASMYKSAGERDAVKARVDKAAEFWDIGGEYELEPGALHKEARHRFTLEIPGKGGSTAGQWVLESPRDLEKAAIQIFDNKGLFNFDQRSSLVRKMSALPICKEADLRPDVREYMEKAAGYGMSSKADAMEAIRARAALYESLDPSVADRAATLAEKVAEIVDIFPSDLRKIASVLGACDEACGLNAHYSRGFQTPEEVLFKWTEKTAAEALTGGKVKLMNGAMVPMDKLSEEVLDRYFSDAQGEVIDGTYMDKLAAAASLPKPDADDLLKYAGIDGGYKEDPERGACDASGDCEAQHSAAVKKAASDVRKGEPELASMYKALTEASTSDGSGNHAG